MAVEHSAGNRAAGDVEPGDQPGSQTSQSPSIFQSYSLSRWSTYGAGQPARLHMAEPVPMRRCRASMTAGGAGGNPCRPPTSAAHRGRHSGSADRIAATAIDDPIEVEAAGSCAGGSTLTSHLASHLTACAARHRPLHPHTSRCRIKRRRQVAFAERGMMTTVSLPAFSGRRPLPAPHTRRRRRNTDQQTLFGGRTGSEPW